MSGVHAEFADIMSRLEEKLDGARAANAEAQKYERENKRLNDEWTARFEEIRDNRSKLLSEAAVEAKKLIAQARKKAAEILDEAQTNTPTETLQKRRRVSTG
jgi:dsDNA-specific endonuclease/ATPase MutS2